MEKVENHENKKKVGRPKKYDTSVLEKILLKYASENTGGKITVGKLVKYSGLPIQAWRFNDDIKKMIKELNEPQYVIGVDTEELKTIPLPSAEDIVNANYKNKDRLTKVISDLINVYQHTYNQLFKLRKSEEELENVKQELILANSKIQNLEREIEFYKHKAIGTSIKTTTAVGRTELNTEENLIDIKKYSETNTTFKDLFED